MSRRLRKSSGIASSEELDRLGDGADRNGNKPASPQPPVAAPGKDTAQAGYAAASELRPDPHSAQYILAMVRDLKKLAAKSGLPRVALILEMAELEAHDQIRRP